MDRYSTGSAISKEIIDVGVVKRLENKDNMFEIIKEDIKENEVSLEEVDNKILTIDDFLKDISSM